MIGRLRHRITLQALDRVPDGRGGYAEEWVSQATVWAAVVPLGGYERLTAERLENRVSHRITIRYRAGVSDDWRVLYDGRTFRIRSVVNQEERDRWMTLDVEETT